MVSFGWLLLFTVSSFAGEIRVEEDDCVILLQTEAVVAAPYAATGQVLLQQVGQQGTALSRSFLDTGAAGSFPHEQPKPVRDLFAQGSVTAPDALGWQRSDDLFLHSAPNSFPDLLQPAALDSVRMFEAPLPQAVVGQGSDVQRSGPNFEAAHFDRQALAQQQAKVAQFQAQQEAAQQQAIQQQVAQQQQAYAQQQAQEQAYAQQQAQEQAYAQQQAQQQAYVQQQAQQQQAYEAAQQQLQQQMQQQAYETAQQQAEQEAYAQQQAQQQAYDLAQQQAQQDAFEAAQRRAYVDTQQHAYLAQQYESAQQQAYAATQPQLDAAQQQALLQTGRASVMPRLDSPGPMSLRQTGQHIISIAELRNSALLGRAILAAAVVLGIAAAILQFLAGLCQKPSAGAPKKAATLGLKEAVLCGEAVRCPDFSLVSRLLVILLLLVATSGVTYFCMAGVAADDPGLPCFGATLLFLGTLACACEAWAELSRAQGATRAECAAMREELESLRRGISESDAESVLEAYIHHDRAIARDCGLQKWPRYGAPPGSVSSVSTAASSCAGYVDEES